MVTLATTITTGIAKQIFYIVNHAQWRLSTVKLKRLLMLVTVEQLVKKLMKEYGFNQILRDHDLILPEVIQVLHDHGYLDLERYEDEDR